MLCWDTRGALPNSSVRPARRVQVGHAVKPPTTFSLDALRIDPAAASATIERAIVAHVTALRRRGVVVGLSGGIDSSVVTHLCVRALGASRVQVLLMPERPVPDGSRVA